jgi:hypothetical protein
VKEGSTVHDTDTTTFKVKDCEQKPCKVWIEIIDKYCYGYALYVDGKYKFTEGQDGTPDGYCRFDVTPGTHKFELSKDRCSVSKSWYCQCGTYYSWVSMNDMYPHWCDCNKKPDLIMEVPRSNIILTALMSVLIQCQSYPLVQLLPKHSHGLRANVEISK